MAHARRAVPPSARGRDTVGGTVRALGAGMHGLRPQGGAEAGRQAQARAGARADPQQATVRADKHAQPLSPEGNFLAGGWVLADPKGHT